MARKLNLVKDFIAQSQGSIDISLSPVEIKLEEELVQRHPLLFIPPLPLPYRRDGYGLLSFCAKRFVYHWLKDYGQTDSTENVQTKLSNSGMAAIDLIFNALALKGGKRIICPKSLYSASSELIDSYKTTSSIEVLRFKNKEELEEILKQPNEQSVLFLEVCANSPRMTFWENMSIKEMSKKVGYVVIDGTLIGASRINPDILNQGNVIYVESLSKNYHMEKSSEISAGISIYPSSLEDLFQSRFHNSGSYLQMNDLMEMPFELYDVGKEKIEQIARNIQDFYRSVKSFCQDGKVSISPIPEDLAKVPLVVFIDFQERSRLEYFLKQSQLKQRQSFGHEETYIIPIGLLWDTAPPGLARIALGRNSENSQLVHALKEASVYN